MTENKAEMTYLVDDKNTFAIVCPKNKTMCTALKFQNGVLQGMLNVDIVTAINDQLTKVSVSPFNV